MATTSRELPNSLIVKASKNDFESLCHLIADSVCRDGALSAERFSSVWSLEEWWQVREFLSDIIKKAVGKGWTSEQITNDLGSLDASYKKIISDVVSAHYPEIKSKLLQQTTAISRAVLEDFDWKLKLAMASDKLATLQEPLLQLDLDIREKNGEKKQVALEMNKAELTKLISSLEGCSKSVQQLTTS